MNIINNYINQIILVVFLAAAAWLGAQAKNLYRKYITTEIKQNVARTAVRFVEQVYIDLHGPEKLAQAMAKASEILEGYGITISEAELVALIEAAVNEFNNAFAKNDAKGRHEDGQTPTAAPAVEASAPEPMSPATVAEIIADMKDAY